MTVAAHSAEAQIMAFIHRWQHYIDAGTAAENCGQENILLSPAVPAVYPLIPRTTLQIRRHYD
jgi:hypothetical protein